MRRVEPPCVFAGGRRSHRAAVGALAVAALVSASYLVLVVGIFGRPHGSERRLLLVSLVAALVAVMFLPLVRRRALEYTRSKLHNDLPSTTQVRQFFGARMSRAVPLDELLLQLAEALRDAGSRHYDEIGPGRPTH